MIYYQEYKNKINIMNNNIYLNGYKIENVKNTENTLNIEGTICHWNTANLNRERVDKNSFNHFFELYNSGKIRPRLNYEHTDQVIGGVDEIVPFDDGLYMAAHLAKNVAIVRDTIIPLIETSDLCSFSTEGLVNYDDIEEFNDGTYYVKNFLLTGISIVSVPADPCAKFSLANFINDYQAEKLKKANENINKSKYYLFF